MLSGRQTTLPVGGGVERKIVNLWRKRKKGRKRVLRIPLLFTQKPMCMFVGKSFLGNITIGSI